MKLGTVLAVILVLNSWAASNAYPTVVGPDAGCRWLDALELEEGGWLCCNNRTLTVQDGRIVGRRRGTTERCDAAAEARTGLPMVPQHGGSALTPAGAFFASLGLTLFAAVVTIAPVLGVYYLYRARRERARVVAQPATPSDSESTLGYVEMSKLQGVHL